MLMGLLLKPHGTDHLRGLKELLRLDEVQAREEFGGRKEVG